MNEAIVNVLVKFRYLFSVLSLLLVVALTLGAQRLVFDSDFKSFFDKDNPQLLAYDNLQAEYTKSDSLIVMIKPLQGDLFNERYLGVVREITEELWNAPFGIRVDSLSNYQHSWGEDDNLTVEDLVPYDDPLSEPSIERIRKIALSEKELVNRFVSRDGRTTLIVASLELPEIVADASPEEKKRQAAARESSFAEISAYGAELNKKLKATYPDLDVHMMGVPLLNHNFNQSATQDALTLIPGMYLIILIILGLFLRSFGAVICCMVIILLSTTGAMGWAGWFGYSLNSVTVICPIIILTIAVCDSVHLIVSYMRNLALKLPPAEAMRECLAINLLPIVLTSVTTAIGFLTLNFSESPFFRAFGNISAFGVMLALVLTLITMPTLVCLMVRKVRVDLKERSLLTMIPDYVIANKKRVFFGSLVVAAALIACVPLNVTNNDPINFFKPGTPYRDAAIFSQKNLPGIKEIHFSVSCGDSACVNDPDYLQKLEQFTTWFEQQPGVEYVASYADIVKRLNRNMHGEDPGWYRIPDTQALAAQYQLLYEFSLPYGLDLNNTVNFDKSATRVSVWLRQVKTKELITTEQRALAWFDSNAPELKTHGSSVDMMFAVQNIRDISEMTLGAVFAIIGVTITILLATRSVRHGLLSVVPNAFPAAMGLGIWGLVIGEVNMAVTIVFSITLGLVVDNTVHFISKYRYSLNRDGNVEQAIRYAFDNVGAALIITAAVLTLGFGMLGLSSFNMNAYMGGLTALTIVIALVFDFLMLPALLLLVDKNRTTP